MRVSAENNAALFYGTIYHEKMRSHIECFSVCKINLNQFYETLVQLFVYSVNITFSEFLISRVEIVENTIIIIYFKTVYFQS